MSLRLRALAPLFAVALAAPALAADLPVKKEAPAPASAPTPMFDFAFGGKLMSDYILRGVTQTNHRPGVTAYGEARLNANEMFQAYAGVQIWSVKLPTNPAAEVDLYGGLRANIGPVALDAGYVWYAYPNNTRRYYTDGVTTAVLPFAGAGATTPKDPSFGEIYGKATYTWNDMVVAGANVYYAPDWTHTGAHGTYASATLKVNLPHDFYVSGEFGRQFLGRSNAALGSVKFKSYNTWNVGAGWTYKVASLDLRYSGTDLSKANCYLNTSDPAGNPVGGPVTGRSSWCGQRFMATLSFDISGKDLK